MAATKQAVYPLLNLPARAATLDTCDRRAASFMAGLYGNVGFYQTVGLLENALLHYVMTKADGDCDEEPVAEAFWEVVTMPSLPSANHVPRLGYSKRRVSGDFCLPGTEGLLINAYSNDLLFIKALKR